MTQKTKKEIIDETATYTLSTRATDQNQFCFYLTEDGKTCGVGRCCTNPSTKWIGSITGGVTTPDSPPKSWINIEDELKPEYKGHELAFWQDIQNLHDSDLNWDEKGPNQYGLDEIKRLHDKWDD